MTAPPEDPALTGYRVFDPTDPHETNCGPFLCRETADGELQWWAASCMAAC